MTNEIQTPRQQREILFAIREQDAPSPVEFCKAGTSLEAIDLRAQNETMKAERSFANNGIRTLRAENERLRAALEKAAKVLALGFNPGGDEDTILMMRSTLQHAANDCAGALKEAK